MKRNLFAVIGAFLLLISFSECKKSETSSLSDNRNSKLNPSKNYEDYFVVNNLNSGSLSFINAATKTVSSTVTIPNSQLYYTSYLPHKDRLYVTDAGNSAVQVIDAETRTVETSIPVGSGTIMHLTSHQKKDRLWVVNNTARTVTEINANNNQIRYVLQLNYTPHDVAVNANGTKIYISLNKGGTWHIDTYSTDIESTGNYELIDSRAFGNNWLHLFYSNANDILYAADQGLGKYWALDPDNLNAPAPNVSIPGAHGLALSGDEKFSYIAAMGTNTVYVYDNTTNQIISQRVSTVSPNIHNVAVDLTNELLLGTHSGATSTNVSTYSINNGMISQGPTISVGLNPQGITYYARKLPGKATK